MTVERWLEHAKADAIARGLGDLLPLLGALAAATSTLRHAPWVDPADEDPSSATASAADPTAHDE